MTPRAARYSLAALLAIPLALGIELGLVLSAPVPVTERDYLSSVPPALVGAPFVGPVWLDAVTTHAVTWRYDERGFWTPNDHADAITTTVGGFRVTPGQPSAYEHTLWLLGSSVVFGWYVPDADTLSAALQRDLPTWRVVNVGAIPNTLAQQAARLVTLPIRAGDVVISYDALSDVLSDHFTPARIRAGIARLRALATERGAVFYACLPPGYFDVPEAAREPSADVHPSAVTGQQARNRWDAYRASALAAGAIDVSRPVTLLRMTGRAVFIDVAHLNDAGNETAANGIAAVVGLGDSLPAF